VAHVKRGFWGVACRKLPMCKVLGKVQEVTPQFTDANTPQMSAVTGLEPISGHNI